MALTEEIADAIDAAVGQMVTKNISSITRTLWAIAVMLVIIIAGGSAWVTRVDHQLASVVERMNELPPPWLQEQIRKIEETNEKQQAQINRLIRGD